MIIPSFKDNQSTLSLKNLLFKEQNDVECEKLYKCKEDSNENCAEPVVKDS